MDFWVLFVLRVSLMAIPLYLCNGFALIFGGKTPIDFGRNFFDGRRILGNGKSIKGTFAGIFFASLGVLAINVVFPQTGEILGTNYFWYGVLLAFGAILGDFAGSFLKRRLNIERGKSVFLLDQLDFVAGGLAAGALLAVPSTLEAIFLLAFTLLLHVVSNRVAYIGKIKRVPW
ncbi:MAG: CDP-2,3-bis-(O-geranylgeranyl)-sn-glycerol synthase [archaeon]